MGRQEGQGLKREWKLKGFGKPSQRRDACRVLHCFKLMLLMQILQMKEYRLHSLHACSRARLHTLHTSQRWYQRTRLLR